MLTRGRVQFWIRHHLPVLLCLVIVYGCTKAPTVRIEGPTAIVSSNSYLAKVLKLKSSDQLRFPEFDHAYPADWPTSIRMPKTFYAAPDSFNQDGGVGGGGESIFLHGLTPGSPKEIAEFFRAQMTASKYDIQLDYEREPFATDYLSEPGNYFLVGLKDATDLQFEVYKFEDLGDWTYVACVYVFGLPAEGGR